jgi:hypothetical protein
MSASNEDSESRTTGSNKQQLAKNNDSNPNKKSELKQPDRQRHQQQQKESSTTTASSSFRIEPLTERSIWTRYDVGPFLVVYMILIALDKKIQEQEFNLSWFQTTTVVATPTPAPGDGIIESLLVIVTKVSPRTILTILFVITLVLQLVIALFCQWNVHFCSYIGYYRSSSNNKKMETKSYRHWTHCYVSSTSSSSGGGIVPIQRCRTNDGSSNNRNNENVRYVIHFQDRIFRFFVPEKDNQAYEEEDYD